MTYWLSIASDFLNMADVGLDDDNDFSNMSFSQFIGHPDYSDDAERGSSLGLGSFERVGDGLSELGDGSVADSELQESLKRSLQQDDDSLEHKRVALIPKYPPRVVGESSDAVFDAVVSTSKSLIPLQPWEHGVFGYICGNCDIVPAPDFPKLEQPLDLAPPPQMDTEDPTIVATDREPVFSHAVKLRARWTSYSDEDARLHVLMRWRAALYHNLEGSDTGRMLRDNDPSTHLDILSEIFEGKSTNTLAKRVNSLLHYLNYWRFTDEETTDFLPFSSVLVYGYLKHLRVNNRLSAAKDFLQSTKFCEHVLGLKSVDSLSRPWISGIAKAAYSYTKPKKESRPLTVKEIIQLETFLIKGSCHHLDRYACGIFLCMLYGRARVSDLRSVSNITLDFCNDSGDRTGYIEIRTTDYKNSRISRATGKPYIILVPVYGLCGESWGRAFVKAAAANGVDLESLIGPMLLCPDASGQLTHRYPSSNEVTNWVNGILNRLIHDRQPGFTSHGLKATMLSWASKAGVDEYDRHVLGGHSMKGRQVAATYARDILTGPVKKLEEVIASVRHGNFLPDSTRANMFPRSSGVSSGSKPVETHLASTTSGSVLVDTNSVVDGANVPGPVEDQEKTVEVESGGENDDSSSSSSTTSESEPDDVVAEECMSKSPHQILLAKFHWKDNCNIYKHVRTKKLHLQSEGSETGTFLCGRHISDDYSPFSGTIACESWKCKQCDSCRPLHDVGSMISHLDRMQAKRALDR